MYLPRAIWVVLVCASVAFMYSTAKTLDPLSDEFIDHINKKQKMWRAGRNFHPDTPLAHIRALTCVLKDPKRTKLPEKTHDLGVIASLPESFDPRDKWLNCPSLNKIRDQGACGSCWAFGAVETMTDRYCIYSNGTKQFHFSAQDLVSCCDMCGFGCLGGWHGKAFEYWRDSGIVSGGQYNSHDGCRPYEIPPCAHHTDGKLPPCEKVAGTPVCRNKCIPSYDVPYEKDRHFAQKIYSVSGEDNIKAELYNNGPVEAGFDVYSDFLHYKSGVYKHVGGGSPSGHAVKMLGWGVEDGNKYWLVANSWNSDWGDKGYFKILRGENHCGIEDEIVTGEPLIN